jgi:hypothetical protein
METFDLTLNGYSGDAITQTVVTLRYKPEGQGFESRGGNGIFLPYIILAAVPWL